MRIFDQPESVARVLAGMQHAPMQSSLAPQMPSLPGYGSPLSPVSGFNPRCCRHFRNAYGFIPHFRCRRGEDRLTAERARWKVGGLLRRLLAIKMGRECLGLPGIGKRNGDQEGIPSLITDEPIAQ